jgi:RNA-directed DNA polymerase
MSVHSNDGTKAWLTKLDRIGELSASQSDIVFNNLGHMIDYDLLKELYTNLDGKKAIGVDKVSKEAYGENLIEHLTCLLERIRRGTYNRNPPGLRKYLKKMAVNGHLLFRALKTS